jgi:hypothetical protein
MIRWKYTPSGICPVQAEGWFLGYYFYFRARHDQVRIEFSPSEEAWVADDICVSYVLLETVPFAAGWLPKWRCRLLIWKGCFWFLFNRIYHQYLFYSNKL